MKKCLKLAVLSRALLFCLLLQSCTAQTSKINGISYVAARDRATQAHVQPVLDLGASHAAIMPFGFIRGDQSAQIIHNTKRQWFGERRDGAQHYIELLKANGIKIMLKPQLWISRGTYTGYLKMEDETQWKALEASYRDFIMEYATLAQETEVALFSIGTELEQFVVNRPEFWKSLIKDIRKVYKGKLTYASNWDEYKRVPFWDQLDYIGIDGYFPVCEQETPTVASARAGWQPWKATLKAFAKAQSKQILFTEWGYRSMDYTGKEPWVSDHTIEGVNLQAQVNVTRAAFEELWAEDWFAGGFIWKWFIYHDRVGGVTDNQFTPQNKPAEAVIREYFTQE
ncbi:MAG: glycoside hydrolase [Dokdonia sp.]|jgi:hypothetical protein|nr:glycoside hydrolase [Cytophagaceae bacterium]